SNINPSGYNQAVTFTAALTPKFGGSATGTVTFKDGVNTLGTATVSGNLAAITVSTLALGTHSITAAYSGDSNFTGSSSGVVSQVVTKASTTTVVDSSLNPAFVTQSITYTATVTSQYGGMVSGSVVFKSGDSGERAGQRQHLVQHGGEPFHYRYVCRGREQHGQHIAGAEAGRE